MSRGAGAAHGEFFPDSRATFHESEACLQTTGGFRQRGIPGDGLGKVFLARVSFGKDGGTDKGGEIGRQLRAGHGMAEQGNGIVADSLIDHAHDIALANKFRVRCTGVPALEDTLANKRNSSRHFPVRCGKAVWRERHDQPHVFHPAVEDRNVGEGIFAGDEIWRQDAYLSRLDVVIVRICGLAKAPGIHGKIPRGPRSHANGIFSRAL